MVKRSAIISGASRASALSEWKLYRRMRSGFGSRSGSASNSQRGIKPNDLMSLPDHVINDPLARETLRIDPKFEEEVV